MDETDAQAGSVGEDLVLPDAGGTAESLVAQASAFAAAARSPRTRREYTRAWQAFVAWCREHGQPPLPANPDAVALYLTARATAGKKVATVEQDLSAITAAHRLAGLPSPREAAVVRAVRRGIRRQLGVAQGQKAPLLAETLKAVMRELPDTLAGLRDRALLLVGFAGAFRRSELVSIAVEDLEWVEEGLKVRLRRSKADQEGEGTTVGIPKGSRPSRCPPTSLARWLEASVITTWPVFREVTRHGAVGEGALSGASVDRIVKRAAALAGLEPAAFAGHSLRAGLASSAARARKPERDIMRQTRHKSAQMVRRYIRGEPLHNRIERLNSKRRENWPR